MQRHGVVLGRVGGIAIVIQPLWIAIVALMTWTLGDSYFPDQVAGIDPVAANALGLLSALLLFLGILLHELGHAIVARRRGIEVDEIDLWLLGGVARLRGEPQRAVDELAFAAAGPAVTAVLLCAFVGLDAVVPADPAWLDAVLGYQIFACVAILALNLLPAFPLDGGRILRAAIWWRIGRRTAATEAAAQIGGLFATALIALGTLSILAGSVWGLWTIAIGVFLLVAGRAEREHERISDALGGLRAADVIRGVPVSIPENVTAEDAVRAYFARHLYTAFPVVGDGGRVVGLIAIEHVRSLAPEARARRTVGSLADRNPALLIAADAPVVDVIASPTFERIGRGVVVDADGRAVGVISVTDLQRAIRAHDLVAA